MSSITSKLITLRKITLTKKNIKQIIQFAIVGVIGTIINLFVLYLLTVRFNVYYLISASFAFLIALTNNFILNKIWTFKEKFQEETMNKYAIYTVISLIALGINLLVLYILVEYIDLWSIFHPILSLNLISSFPIRLMLSQIVAILFGFAINFLGNRLYTFRTKIGGPQMKTQEELYPEIHK